MRIYYIYMIYSKPDPDTLADTFIYSKLQTRDFLKHKQLNYLL